MSEPVADRSELPPFSFKKKPIEQYCFQTNHSHISDILPSRHHDSVAPDQSPNSTISSRGGMETSSMGHEVDYDQQIRAPRMSSANFYTYKSEKDKRGVSVSGVSNKSKTGSLASSSSGNEKIAEVFTKDQSEESSMKDSKYLPANFDLTQPTRRFSEPLNPEPETSSKKALRNYTNDNYIYEKEDDEHKKLLKALDNLNSNKTTEEREQGRIKNQTSVFQIKNRADIKGGDVKQVYGQKKPLGKPAVLRPIVSSSQEPTDRLAPSVSIVSTPNTSPTGSIDGSSQPTFMEPTHVHWKPNSSTNHCMKCFDNFSVFPSIKKRRHHCRHCGGIFCSSCLMDSENEKILLDNEARFIVPIFKNLSSEDYQDIFVNFKSFKVCKPCGQTYFNLITDINSKNLKIPYVFIENAFLKKCIQQQIEERALRNSRLQDSNNDIDDSNTIMVDSQNRKSSINNVPTDWTWSSF